MIKSNTGEFQYSHPIVQQDFEAALLIGGSNEHNKLCALIDSTLLSPTAIESALVTLCEQAQAFHFRSVCVPPCYVSLASKLLTSTSVLVCTVIGFPNGYTSFETKCFETKLAIENGATEIDFVQNVSHVKNKKFDLLKEEFLHVVNSAGPHVVKVILETALLTEEEIYACTLLAAQCGVHIVKTSTGFANRGASLHDIEIIATALNDHFKKSGIRHGIKASGGIRDSAQALAFIKAGATRLGTSNGLQIIQNTSQTVHVSY